MKKILWILALMPLLAFAQKEHVVKEYCSVTNAKGLNPYFEIHIENTDSILSDSCGNKIKFNGIHGMLSYMSEKGWELFPTILCNQYGVPERYIFWREKKEGE